MYWMAVAVVGIFCVLLYLGRKEEVGENISALLTPFYKIAMYSPMRFRFWSFKCR